MKVSGNMSTKSMFFGLVLSELKFLGMCIVLFVANLAFWLDDKGIAEQIFHIHLTPSRIPLYIFVMILALAFIAFTVYLSDKVKKLQESNYPHCRRAVILTAIGHLLAFCSLSLFVISQESNSMTTVIPSLFNLYFAIRFVIFVMLFFNHFVRRNKSKIEV